MLLPQKEPGSHCAFMVQFIGHVGAVWLAAPLQERSS